MTNNQKILTSLSALYKQNLISFSPKKIYVEMLFGVNTSNYSSDYKIKLQKLSTFMIGSFLKDGELVYRPERLFIELNKFPLENTIKNEAILNLKKIMNPELVHKYYKALKNHRRNLDRAMIEKYLDENLLRIKEVLTNENDKKATLREYIMALVSKKEVPVNLIKGGSAVEIYTPYNRATLDIDLHADEKDAKAILNFLSNPNHTIYFEASEPNLDINFKKRIIQLNLIPKTRQISIKPMLQNIIIKICFNTLFSNSELLTIKKDYQITKKRLKRLSNSLVTIFTKEMLLAEKYQAIISKPEITTRTKDLIDLKPLWDENINYNNFKKWFFRKWSVMKISKNKSEVVAVVKANQFKELTKIKQNFEAARKMYDYETSYEECLSIYRNLSAKILGQS